MTHWLEEATVMKRGSVSHAVALLSLCLFAGCDYLQITKHADTDAPAMKQAEAIKLYGQSRAVQGTIGSYTEIEGLLKLSVRGYGLVVGLGENGSQTCPDRIRRRLSAEIRKKYGFGDSRLGRGHITPEKMINSPDTAVVFVQGDIGAAALARTKFDLTVQALRGTETSSLKGGRLYTCDLYYYRPVGGGMVQEGKVVATGEGPLFINPFAQRRSSATPVNLRTARIISGGTNLQDRRVRLKLFTPSYARVTSIRDRINNRFGRGAKIALAESPSYIALQIPRSSLNRELYFVALVRHLYLSRETGFGERQALELAAELPDLQAPHDSIGLALEGIGKTARPVIRDLYTHKLPHVAYYAARTGLHLDDRLAASVLQQHALDPNSSYQLEAIRDLGDAVGMLRATNALWMVINSDLDLRTRILAYEGLIKHRDPMVTSTEIGKNFVLDHIPISRGSGIIYGKVTDQPRLAIIGDVRCKTPLFYHDSRGAVTMSASAQDTSITIVRTTPSGRVSPPASAPLELKDLVPLLGHKASVNRFGQVEGLGLGYPEIIDIVSALCENGAIDAQFRLESPSTETTTGPKRKGGRPESEL